MTSGHKAGACAQMVDLGGLLAAPEAPDLAPLLLRHETRSLRDARALLAPAAAQSTLGSHSHSRTGDAPSGGARRVSVGGADPASKPNAARARAALADAAAHAAAHGHPRLWRSVAEAALGAGELAVAEDAFVRCADYNVRRARPHSVATDDYDYARVAALGSARPPGTASARPRRAAHRSLGRMRQGAQRLHCLAMLLSFCIMEGDAQPSFPQDLAGGRINRVAPY
jgi:hypothetical protein